MAYIARAAGFGVDGVLKVARPKRFELLTPRFVVTRLFVRTHRRFGDLSTNLFTSGLPSATVIVPVACTILARVHRPRELVAPLAVDRDFSMRVINPADLLSEDE